MSWGDDFHKDWLNAGQAERNKAARQATGFTPEETLRLESAMRVSLAERFVYSVEKSGQPVSTPPSLDITPLSQPNSLKSWAANAANWATSQTARAKERISELAADAGKAMVSGATKVKKKTKSVAESAYKGVRKQFQAAKAGIASLGCKTQGGIVRAAGSAAGFLSRNPALAKFTETGLSILGNSSQRVFDGQLIGSGCSHQYIGVPKNGIKPECNKPPVGKAYFINGIGVDYVEENWEKVDGICKSMQALADATCLEVTGIYAANEGPGKNLGECLRLIMKGLAFPPVTTLAKQLLADLAKTPNGPIRVFAHSEGGLFTQNALRLVQQQLIAGVKPFEPMTRSAAMKKMSFIEVNSFGTANDGWVEGPQYQQFTNSFDLVPVVIGEVQASKPGGLGANVKKNIDPGVFDHFGVGINPHDFVRVYVPQLKKKNGLSCCPTAQEEE